ncbi:hypothetical protein [Zeimonas arvi]|uniref:Uncharacterized protein n=1 Tax=Zeimonas arvi TaxID=2498847 RepID=A0A5C8NQY7_9BURK|nr:hypothetical protein [Zeimonas arvi]TXL63556.1 hypothetical protein FHP08_17120 [Zeimonas arvi]
MKFVSTTQTGEPVESNSGTVAHRYVAADGQPVVVKRDERGRLLPGSRLVLLRAPGTGREPKNADSVRRRALGLPSRWAAHNAKRRKGGAE